MRHGFKAWLVCSTATAAALWTPAALAQESGTDSGETQSEAATTARGAAAALESEDIVVTALKRSDNLQTVPVAISAYGAEQLQALNFRDIGSLGFTMPNGPHDDKGPTQG